jgi:hypothetical protein
MIQLPALPPLLFATCHKNQYTRGIIARKNGYNTNSIQESEFRSQEEEGRRRGEELRSQEAEFRRQKAKGRSQEKGGWKRGEGKRLEAENMLPVKNPSMRGGEPRRIDGWCRGDITEGCECSPA